MKHSQGMFDLWSKPEVCEHSGPAEDFNGNPIRLPAEEAADSDKIIDFFIRYQRRSEKVRWAMMNEEGTKFIGALGFNSIGQCSELGYHLNPDYWGKGYMSEACRGVRNWLALQPNSETGSIEAFIDSDNIASINLIRALGFAPTGESNEGADRYLLQVSK